MATDRLITIAIHTFERAQRMKNLLEAQGVRVSLQNVNLTNPSISSGVRVRISESDLPLALRIVENAEIFTPAQDTDGDNGDGSVVLVPVDFSENSFKASMVAMRIAYLHSASVHLLHSFIDPVFSARASMQLSETLDFEPVADIVGEMEAEKEISQAAREQMDDFEQRLREKIKDGIVPPVKFDSEIIDGLPEETVDEYAESHHPLLIVMGTKGTDDTNRNFFGSVAAEVLDSCRSTILTVPESASIPKDTDILHVVFFASSRQDDILTLDALYRLLPDMALDVTLVSLPEKGASQTAPKLLSYCKEHYPAYTFSLSPLSLSNPVEDYERIAAHHTVDIIVVGTRKRNIFARLFSPTLAHRLLFHADTPLLSIPV